MSIRIPKKINISVGVVFLCIACLFLASCDQDYIFDFDRSVNFFKPGPKWPKLRNLKPIEKQVYEKYGKPDMFRVQYDPQGNIKVRSALEQEWGGKRPKDLPPFSWVYLNRNEEIVFSHGTYREQPLGELEKLVIKSGDPEMIKEMQDGMVKWTYYSTGKIYTIYQNRIVSTQQFPPMGTYHK